MVSSERLDKNVSIVLDLAVHLHVRDMLELFTTFINRGRGAGNYEPDILGETCALSFEKQTEPLVSIIIPAFNQWEYTRSCLVSILRNTADVPHEIILADDTSTDETKRAGDLVSGITVIRNERNLGFIRNCNNAASRGAGKYLLFLNNDVIVREGWLKPLVELLERDPAAGMAGPKLVYPNGLLQDAGAIVWSDGNAWNYGRWDNPDKTKYNYAREADYVSGACMLVRRDLWEDIGGFDLRYAPAYYEDTDLAFEIRSRGYKVLYQPKSAVVHFEGITSGLDIRKGVKSFQEVNREKFFRKWEAILKKEHFRPGHVHCAVRSKGSEW
ncbi:MAG: glycosyltransferase family 2 protein [Desulfuromonadales bacterium]|nr:glycosyltransferase family 2 protein [Desulfuromonadales bacterium]